MTNRVQNTRYRIRGSLCAFCLFCALCFATCALFVSVLHAQEENEEEPIIELPPVKIEVIDTTSLDIPREKFRSFMKPDPEVYAPLSLKERSWYVPSTSIPEKLREMSGGKEEDLLLSITAQFGIPQALAYQILLTKGFDNSEMLLDMGRKTLWSERTAETIADPASSPGNSIVDRFQGAFTHQTENFGLKADMQYSARRLDYLNGGGGYSSDRSSVGFSAGWDQRISDNARSSLNFGLASLKMAGGQESGLNIKGSSGLRILLSRSNPIDMGLSVEYADNGVEAAGVLPAQNFSEAVLRLHLRDNHIRAWIFVLGIGVEAALDARKTAEDANWSMDIYPNPCVSLTSQIGSRTTLRLGVERYVLKQDFNSLYLDEDYVKFNPALALEKTWDLNASLKCKLTPAFVVTVGAFNKEIRDLTIFRQVNAGVLLWEPDSLDSARIAGFRSCWELSLIDGRIKQSLEYVHEVHDQDIPYRSKDRGCLTVTCLAPFGFKLSLSGEYYGVRCTATNGSDAETLSGYFLWKPRISRAFGEHASAFLIAGFYAGQDDYQIWKGYRLPTQTVDFGLTVKF